jgi:hypothetical protein
VRAPLSGRLSARGLPAVGWLYDIVGTAAAHGHGHGHAGFIEYSAGGAMTRAERTRHWSLDNADVLQQALIGPPGAHVTTLRRSVCRAFRSRGRSRRDPVGVLRGDLSLTPHREVTDGKVLAT